MAAQGVVDKEGDPLVSPPLDIPDEFIGTWLRYFEVSNQVTRIQNGVCGRIPPSEWLAWSTITGIKFDNAEYELLNAMDEEFFMAMNKLIEERIATEADRKKANE